MKSKSYIFSVVGIVGIIAPAYSVNVSRIDVSGTKRMDAESVRILAGVKVGDNINSEQTNEITKKLQNSGYFSNINVSLADSVLKIKLVEAPVVSVVTVEGNDEISTDDLKKKSD